MKMLSDNNIELKNALFAGVVKRHVLKEISSLNTTSEERVCVFENVQRKDQNKIKWLIHHVPLVTFYPMTTQKKILYF